VNVWPVAPFVPFAGAEDVFQMRNTLLALFLGAAALTIAPQGVRAEDHRYYDRDHKDYHAWNEPEQRAYHHWYMEERHEAKFRDYNRLNRADQRAYWQWRHEHADWH